MREISLCGTTRAWSTEDLKEEGREKRCAWSLLEGFLEEGAAVSHQLLTNTVLVGSRSFPQGPDGSLRGVTVPSGSSLQGLKALSMTGPTFPRGTLELAGSAEPHLSLKHGFAGPPEFRVSV